MSLRCFGYAHVGIDPRLNPGHAGEDYISLLALAHLGILLEQLVLLAILEVNSGSRLAAFGHFDIESQVKTGVMPNFCDVSEFHIWKLVLPIKFVKWDCQRCFREEGFPF